MESGQTGLPVNPDNMDKGPFRRVFINNVDKYTSRYIGKFLSACVDRVCHVADQYDDEQSNESLSQEDVYQIVGTVSGKPEQKSSFAVEEYINLKREELFHRLMESDVIIYNIYNEDPDQREEASWAVSALHKETAAFPGPKTFILISSVMTWALTKTLDPKDPGVNLTEWDYRRRKPHPNFKEHIAVEKLVVKLGKANQSLFSTYVIASGLQYGMGEQVFHYFFKTAWLGEKQEMPIFGDGTNFIPTIHISDLAGIVHNVIYHKPKPQYILGVDESRKTIAEIISAIALVLGPDKTKKLPKEDIFLIEELRQSEIDHLFIDLRMDAIVLKDSIGKENFHMKWVSKNGIVKSIKQIVKEYKFSRDLLPIRICLLGPPAVGKSTVAEKICKHYKLHHVKLKETVAETLARIESRVRMEEIEKETDDETNETQEYLMTLTKNMEKNRGRLDEPYIIQFMREKLKTKPCQNQGFVLDGFPKTYSQAKELFGDDVGQAKNEQFKITLRDTEIIPEFVFSLDASDEFLQERVMNLPESVVQGTSHSMGNYFSYLAIFRKNYSDDETVLDYFEEHDILPHHIEVNSDNLENVLVMEKVIESVGKARNYSPTTNDMEQERRQAEIQLAEKDAARWAELQREKEEEELRAQKQEEWKRYLEEESRQEEALLMADSAFLREYLMNTVLPTVTRGCLEICELRPEDPIEFLAEHLLQNNPEVQ